MRGRSGRRAFSRLWRGEGAAPGGIARPGGGNGILHAAEIRIRAKRRLGQMIAAQKEMVGLATGGDAARTRFQKSTELTKPTLADVRIDYLFPLLLL